MIHNFAEFVFSMVLTYGRINVRVNQLAGTQGFEVFVNQDGKQYFATLTPKPLIPNSPSSPTIFDYDIPLWFGDNQYAPSNKIALFEDCLVDSLNASVKESKYGKVYRHKDQSVKWR